MSNVVALPQHLRPSIFWGTINPNIVLSNNGLTAFATLVSTPNWLGISSYPVSSGKYYWECVVNTLNTAGGTQNEVGFGIINQTYNPTNFLGKDVNSFGFYISDQVYYNNSNITNWASFGQGDNVSFALDLTNGNIWARVNGGNWNNSGLANPATNTGGQSISGIQTSAINAAFVFRNNSGVNEQITAQFASTSWTYTAPTGFVAFPTLTSFVYNYLYPGAVQSKPTAQLGGTAVLSWTNAFPGIPFPQHKSGQSTVQSYLFPGALQPQFITLPPSAFTLMPQIVT